MLTDVMPETPAESDAADRSLVVRFHTESKIDNARMTAAQEKADKEAKEKGTVADPVPLMYKDVEYVTILVPGDKTLTINRPVMKSDLRRFPVQYQAFKNARREVLSGTPLAGWPLVTDSQRKELEFFNIFTVEQLASVNDNFASAMMGVQQLKQSATKFLQAKKGDEGAVKLAAELKERDSKIAALESQMQDLVARLTAEAKSAKK